MEDFLGTTIQFAEKELIALEEEHALNIERTVARLIESGFLDSDYDGSSGTYSDCSSVSEIEIESIQSNESSDDQQTTEYSQYTDETHITFTYYSLVLILLFVCCFMISAISMATTKTNINQYVLDYDLFDLNYGKNVTYDNEEMHDNNGRMFEHVLLYGFVEFWCQQTNYYQLMNDISPWLMEHEYENKMYRQQNQNMDKKTKADTEYLKVSLWVALSLLLSDKINSVKKLIITY
eukprot:UN11367